MEIILAFLLFFGGFTLGSNAIVNDGGVSELTKMNNVDRNREYVPTTTQGIYLNKTRTCHVTHATTYRDLTHPHYREPEQAVIESDDCEEEDADE